MKDLELEPLDLSLPVMRKLGANWLVDIAKYIANTPDFIVNKLLRSGISEALDETENKNVDIFYHEPALVGS